MIAGATPGVIGNDGATLATLDPATIRQVVSGGTATAGMIAKLRACEHALASGVEEVTILDGRDFDALVSASTGCAPRSATRLVAATVRQV